MERLLEEAGVPDARREADEIYAAITMRSVSAAWLDRGDGIDAPLLECLEAAAAKRAAGWPQAYAAGQANFRGHWLRVDERVLIPRPETEGLVEIVLRECSGRGGRGGRARGDGAAERPALAAADIGTGSGAIAIALALEGPFDRIIATDVSTAALEVARANAEGLGLASRIEFRSGHLLGPLARQSVDVVVSNPPYVRTDELEALDASVRDHEPMIALDAGADGLGPSREIAAAVRAVLRPGGLFALEVDARRAKETADLLTGTGVTPAHIEHDLYERPRYVWARNPGNP